MKRDPESLLLTEDGEAYRRFVEWSVGDGFDLAIIKMTAPVDRNALITWTKEQVPGAREIDLKTIGPQGARLWDLLLEARDQEHATMLLLHGLEESPSRPLILAQLNVERDELVKALALPWVLFVHPATYPDLVDKAPDFVDFAGLWLDEVPRVDDAMVDLTSSSSDREFIVFNEAKLDDAEALDFIHDAAEAIARSQLDQARDLLARHELRQHAESDGDLDPILARCLRAFIDNRHPEAMALWREKLLPQFDRIPPQRLPTISFLVDIFHLRGEVNEALRMAADYLLPAFTRLGAQRACALTLGQIADVLAARGDLDEALRIRREAQLPIYDRLGDELGRVTASGKVADILFARGELDEALRIYREEELPFYDRPEFERERAATMGQIADILMRKGELDDALRIRLDEVKPVYERLGDVRGCALTLSKVADVFTLQGKSEDALRIYREEALPAFKRVGDALSSAITAGRIANILRLRGELDEALRIRREEELPVYESLGDIQAMLAARANIALTLAQRGRPEDREEIENLLALALQDARRLKISETPIIEDIIRRMGRDPNAAPFA